MMAKDPAFLFYPNDYIGGTMGMTFEEKGAYIELLMMQFNRGHMTSHMIGQTVGQLWDKLKDKFIQDGDGLWYNKRLEEEQNKRKTFTESRRNNISGINQYSKKEVKKVGHTVGHMTSHMENVNVNDNVDINVLNLNAKKGKEKYPTFDEFLEYAKTLKSWQPGFEVQLEAKFNQWNEGNWKDGFGKPIKNWKTKLQNTIIYFKAQNGNNGNGSIKIQRGEFDKQKYAKLIADHETELRQNNEL